MCQVVIKIFTHLSGVRMKLFVINVGVNQYDAKKRGMKSPIFEDGRFEFIPIKESKSDSKYASYTYNTLKCFNDSHRRMSYYLPNKVGRYFVHNDPEFETYTYGDVFNPRAGNLRYVNSGDLLFFLARLYDYCAAKKKYTGGSHLYFIGYFKVRCSREFTGQEGSTQMDTPFSKNAHCIKMKNGLHANFRIIKGYENGSYRFLKALKITPEIVELLYDGKHISGKDVFISNRDGGIVRNKTNNKPRRFNDFHSSTRSIQYFLNSESETEHRCVKRLISIANEHCL